MKGYNSLLFLLFVSIFTVSIYYLYNKGNTALFFGKTKTINTTIDSIKLIPGLRGYGFNQKIYYHFVFKNKTYKSYFINNKTKWDIINLRDSLQIKYSEDKPLNNKAIGVYYNYRNLKILK